jgi:UDP-GlcNAc:undecaprenyl-phosphate GlcNAc-1-phosphate transferase
LIIALLAIFLLSLLFAFLFTYQVRAVAQTRRWLMVPLHQRHIHRVPVPRLGGVAIFFSFVLSITLTYTASLRYGWLHAGLQGNRILTILVPASIVFLLGVYDDIHGASPHFKFAVQAVAAAMLFAGGLRITNIPVLFGQYKLPSLAAFICTTIWVLAITNAFNLIDGLDGLAVGSALFSTLVVFIVSLQNGASIVTVMAIALAGAMFGFLRFNFNPATIFLGDSGSLFIGFLLSALALQGAQKSPTIVAVAIPLVSFGLPVLETSLSVLRRFISGRPIFTADREHIHHKLLELGFSHRQVVILLYAVSAGFALLSLLLLWPRGSSLGIIMAVVGCGVWIGVQRLGYLEFGELARVAQRTLEQRHIVVNNLALRRATEDLRTAPSYDEIRRILFSAFEHNDFDGFDLSTLESRAAISHLDSRDNRLSWAAPVSFHWRKPGIPGEMSNLPLWTLSVDLISTNNTLQGALKVHRLYSDTPLQLDVNLLTSSFPVALADALERIVTSAAHVHVMPIQDTGRTAFSAS